MASIQSKSARTYFPSHPHLLLIIYQYHHSHQPYFYYLPVKKLRVVSLVVATLHTRIAGRGGAGVENLLLVMFPCSYSRYMLTVLEASDRTKIKQTVS